MNYSLSHQPQRHCSVPSVPSAFTKRRASVGELEDSECLTNEGWHWGLQPPGARLPRNEDSSEDREVNSGVRYCHSVSGEFICFKEGACWAVGT